MTVTAGSHYRGECRITREGFVRIMQAMAAPEVLEAGDPAAYYDAILRYDCDPLLILAIFHKESTMGRYGTARTTHSWGNTRAPTFGANPVGEVSGRSGKFPIFRDWMDGCISTVARLTTPEWYYARENRTIGEVFTKEPSWAPAGDLNDPAGYLQSVLDFMNQLADVEEQPMADDPHAQWLPSRNYTAGRGPVVLDRIIIHTTEGGYDGSLSWLRGAAAGSSNTQSSAHYLFDANGGRLAQMVREKDTAWTAGNYGWNLRSINIEMEGYAGKGGFTDALYQAVGALVARIAARHKIPIDREHVIGHKDVPNQDHWDPGEHFDFDRLLAIARGETEGHAQYQSVKLQSDKRDMPTGLPLWHGFKTLYEEAERAPNQLGIRLLGVGPITAPFDMAFGDNPGQIYTVVLLERGGGFMYEGGQKEPWRNHALTTWQAVEAWNHAIKHKLIPEHLIPKHLR